MVYVYLFWREDGRKDMKEIDFLGGQLTFKKFEKHFLNAPYGLSLVLVTQILQCLF